MGDTLPIQRIRRAGESQMKLLEQTVLAASLGFCGVVALMAFGVV
jgi:hypothetical protein